ncbi:MAG: T9SS type A sorting domain-containing protein [Bacteroidia bacterium]|nr:T9SS type A sorting domain-containing protein [Bacteroidia bacterium]
MKRKITLGVICLFACNFIYAQTWQWAAGSIGSGNDYAEDCFTDSSGHLYVAGSFDSPTITLGTLTLTNANPTTLDMFIAKYDSLGNVIWAHRAGGSNGENAVALSVDNAGNIYVTGSFNSSSITFGATTLTNASAPSSDLYVTKYDSSGNVIWAKRAGGTSSDSPEELNIDNVGNVYITGEFRSTPMTIGTINLFNTNSTYSDIFTAKYDSSGNVIWARKAGGNDYDNVYSIGADNSGNVFIGGWFYSTTFSFGSISIQNNSGVEHIFLAKYDSNGNILWAKALGGNGWADLNSLTCDAFGNVCIGGSFGTDSIFFGNNLTLPNICPNGDILIAKADSAGDFLWARNFGDNSGSATQDIYVDGFGNLYLAGQFSGDSITLGQTTLYNNNFTMTDIFIAKYDSIGNVIWARSANGNSYDYTYAITRDNFSNIYVTGIFQSSQLIFGSDTVFNLNAPYNDFFITKLKDDLVCSASFNLYPDTSILHNYLAVNYASGTPPLSYDWNWGDGSPHDFTAYPSHTYATAGYYTICLTITDATSCTNTVCQTNFLQITQNSSAPVTMVQVNVVASIPTDVSENQIENNISVFPNPATAEVTINFGKAGRHDVRVCNTLGEVLKDLTLNLSPNGEGLRLDVSSLRGGIYFITVTDENKNKVVRKIVKM